MLIPRKSQFESAGPARAARAFGTASLVAAALAAAPTSASAGDVELVIDLGNGGALALRSDTGSTLDIHGYSIFSAGGFLADTGDETLGGLLSPLFFDVDNAGSDEVAMTTAGGGPGATTVTLPVSPADLALNLAWTGGLGGDPLADLLVEYGPADLGQPVVVQLDPADIVVLTSILNGDYNASGQVEQGDLDLVLQNWGDDVDVTGVPAGWVNDLPSGQIEQTELDGVLAELGRHRGPGFLRLDGPRTGRFWPVFRRFGPLSGPPGPVR